MAASLRLLLHRRRRSLPEGDDMLTEILLRLPPQPSSLPRAAAVCRRWRRLVSDPAFHRRFRIHHRRSPPPLLGFIDGNHPGNTFQPALGAPDRLPPGQFRLKFDDDHHYIALGWRRGLALFLFPDRLQVLVWDPVAGHQHILAVPPDFELDAQISGAVLPAAGDVDHFRVVLVGNNEGKQPKTVLACVYSSETGAWSNSVSTPLPSEGLFFFRDHQTSMLAGDCLHWTVTVAGSRHILVFDLGSQTLDLRILPGDLYTPLSPPYMIMRAKGGGMGFIFLHGFTVEFWATVTDHDGDVVWVPRRTIELDELLELNPEKESPQMIGYAEENNAVFFWTIDAVFVVHLESMQFKKLPKTVTDSYYHPFETVYTPGISGGNERDISGGNERVEVVRHSWWTRWRQHIRRLLC